MNGMERTTARGAGDAASAVATAGAAEGAGADDEEGCAEGSRDVVAFVGVA
jgi:hypothetical protein